MYKGERFNGATHFAGLLLALAGSTILIDHALTLGADPWKLVSCLVFALAMVAVYAASTLYHCTRGPRKRLWEKVDHCAIYLLIAGTYTPLALVPLRGDWGWLLAGTVWAMALFGIGRELWMRGAGPAVPLYVAMGWLGLAAAVPIVEHVSTDGLLWLLGGALLYTVGIIFYVNDKRWLHAHGVWHLFVMGGTSCHFFTVFGFLR